MSLTYEIGEDLNSRLNILLHSPQLPVIEGNPCDKHVMDAANITGFDVMIALRSEDAQNLAICQMASKKFQVKKTVCIVTFLI